VKFLPLVLITAVLGGIVYFGIRLTSAGGDEDGVVLAQPPVAFPDGFVEFEMEQRSDLEVPGTEGAWTVHLGDITDGQVDVTIRLSDGSALLATTSMAENDGRWFKYRDRRYRLTMLELDNNLIGADRAKMDIGTGYSETERIHALLRAIENAEGVTFIRNGDEHSPKAAADHLRRKWTATKNRIGTAELFIEHLATKSSLSDEAYTVKLADGSTTPAGDWFTERLAEIDEQIPE
jgi:hypothetical protein